MSDTELTAYSIDRISAQRAFTMAEQLHYLHRRPVRPTDSFGLFDPRGNVVGFLTFGRPPSASVQRGVCGPDESPHVVELTRLWVSDTVPKNGESFFIGGVLTRLRTERSPLDIVVSYSDTAYGHRGIVYQATNFLYTGRSKKMSDPMPTTTKFASSAGKTTSLRNWYRKHIGDPTGVSLFDLMSARFGKGNVRWVERSRKNRYVMFNGWNRQRRSEARSKLRWGILPYPKETETT